jgi:hypothetical protein
VPACWCGKLRCVACENWLTIAGDRGRVRYIIGAKRMLNKTVVLNLTLLIAHQIDAAYWHEWEMFGLPGGAQVFNVLNMVIFLIVLGCFVPVVARKPSGLHCALAIAAVSALVLPIHAGFALAGYSQFHLPVSIAVIVGTFLVSIVQVYVVLKYRHEFRRA